ncbi:MAG: GntR family transcriptional regulator [Planctomycetota bacterium]|jgi:GntR family transcriptional regulator
MFSIDNGSSVPLAEQVRRCVRRALAEGKLKKGDSLPPVRKVAAQTGVNLNTVARAYRQLEDEGLLRTVRGRGTVVKAEKEPRRLGKRELQSRVRDLVADALLGGHDLKTSRAMLKK